jgi:hypothetical protein
MDFAEKRKLEIEIDNYLAVKDLGVNAYAKEAQEALHRNDYDAAKAAVAKAKDIYTPPVPLLDFLTKRAKAFFSMAEARRAVQRGDVSVDGVAARNINLSIRKGQKVVTKGETYEA